jgi:hypothetical protein
MKFENSANSKSFNYKKITEDFGCFFLTDNFVIGEINEGIRFDWEITQKLVEILLKQYGDNCRVGYISYRINPYSTEQQNWAKFGKKYDYIVASAVVTYNEIYFINATIEKMFSEKSLKRCKNINQAIEWMENL